MTHSEMPDESELWPIASAYVAAMGAAEQDFNVELEAVGPTMEPNEFINHVVGFVTELVVRMQREAGAAIPALERELTIYKELTHSEP